MIVNTHHRRSLRLEGYDYSQAGALGALVGAFKSRATADYIRGVKDKGWTPFRQRLWQRNYYEHIIRDGASLARIREYIDNNPQQWVLDRDNPAYVADPASF
jgi:putative transposase